MREILFRGKRCDNGEWIEGYLRRTALFDAEGAPPHWHMAFVIEPPFEEPFSCEWAEVNPETVGQFTGLCDKNGKRIFEGDVVRYFERQLGGEDVPVIQPVGYEEGGFCVHQYFLNNWLKNAINGNVRLEGIEVIGNIHDNPELLGGNEND